MYVTSSDALTMIPMQINGIHVGKARISSDGAIEIVTATASPLILELREKIESGAARGITLGLIEE